MEGALGNNWGTSFFRTRICPWLGAVAEDAPAAADGVVLASVLPAEIGSFPRLDLQGGPESR